MTVMHALATLVRFWELKARHATVGEPLSPTEQNELLSFLREAAQAVHPNGDAHPATAAGTATPQGLLVDGDEAFAVELQSASASGVVVRCVRRPKLGTKATLRVVDAVVGVEYVLPCNVSCIHDGEVVAVALSVDGAPLRTPFSGARDEGLARTFEPPTSRSRSASGTG